MAASLKNLRRPACVAGPRRSRAALRVVAFRDTHRAKQLVDTAKEFALAWANGHTEGPTKPVMAALEQICAHDIRVRASHPQAGCLTLQGLDGIRAKLARHQETAADQSTPDNAKAEVVLAAANDNTDAAFCLVRVPGIQSRPEAFMLLKMDLMVDDGAKTVTGVEERGQLFNATHTDAGKSTNQVATPFPRDLVKPWGKENQGSEKEERHDADMVQRVESVLASWTSARSTGTDASKMLQEAGLTQDFKLIDGYGSLPESIINEWEQLGSQLGSAGSLECPPPMSYYLPKKPKGQSVTEQSQDAVKEELEQTKKSSDVKCTLLDNAVCLDDAAAFSHWKAIQTNQVTGETQEVDGVEVDILDPKTGGLRAVYLFRDSKKVQGQQEKEETGTPVLKVAGQA